VKCSKGSLQRTGKMCVDTRASDTTKSLLLTASEDGLAIEIIRKIVAKERLYS
jgi:hypothetical protein